jgi:uncharacterized membrane protein
LTSITIPNSVITINQGAFLSCTLLASVIFTPTSTLETIGNYAFYNCTSLTSIAIPISVTSNGIGSNAFQGSGLTLVTIENLQLTGIESPATGVSFFGRTVTTISLLTILRYNADKGNTFPWGVVTFTKNLSLQTHSYTGTIIGSTPSNVPFFDKLINATIGNIVTSIGNSAFSYCTSMTSITLPNNPLFTSIGESAFESTSLTSITIPDSVTSIGNSAFFSCTSLTSVIFTATSTLKTIGQFAFYNCTSLTSITIPNSVTSIGIGNNAFQGSGLTRVIIEDNKLANIRSPSTGVFFFGATVTTIDPTPNITITASGNSAYNFSSTGAINNPTLSFLTGSTVTFTLSNLSFHPFYIKDSNNANITEFSQGQTSGTLTWIVPNSASTFTYYCGNHPVMNGTFNVI